ncbi:unnamed protein product [Cyclocybe aegerita]|uniref:Ferric oxidoreductase domain-containing protein n=1 Tax=Cyclocybe aegerita TaxID=1973307 RepID=A0A8S0XIU3_CYCAE|nr:unnamed protein product [Cyclocybe aegerita]
MGREGEMAGRSYVTYGISAKFAASAPTSTLVTKRPPCTLRAPRRGQPGTTRRGSALTMRDWTSPGIGFNLGQIIVVTAYPLTVVLCIEVRVKAPLISNSNFEGTFPRPRLAGPHLTSRHQELHPLPRPRRRTGVREAQLPTLLDRPGIALSVSVIVHGALWIRNHMEYCVEIMDEQKEQSGVATFPGQGVIVLSSLRVVRRWAWSSFFAVHVLVFPAFFITMCYHTICASPWIYLVFALDGPDILLRMFKIRIKDAVLVPVGKQMTLIRIPLATLGWLAE